MSGWHWRRLEAPGRPVPAGDWAHAFFTTLAARPLSSAVLELRSWPGGSRLDIGAPAGVWEAMRGRPPRPGGSRSRPSLPPSVGPAMSPATAAYGRLVWLPEPVSRPGAPRTPWSTSDRREAPRPAVEVILQLLAQGSLETPPVDLHARLASWGPPGMAREEIEAAGRFWAGRFGALFEPCAPDGPAARKAEEEWRGRTVVRFHSGPHPPPLPRVVTALPIPGVPLGAFQGPSGPHPGAGLRVAQVWEDEERVELWEAERLLRHVAIAGMTGSGKSQFLAHLAGEASRAGLPVVLFDLHGDLAPAALDRFGAADRERCIVIDGARPWGTGRLGVDVLGGAEAPADRLRERDRLVAEVLAALKPLGAGREEFWGPRMERVLESALRVIHEDGGTLAEVADLLAQPRLLAPALAATTDEPALRAFLEELPVVQRRQPDFLASSQNRLSRIALSRQVRALVAPPWEARVDVEAALAEGRSLLVHLPKGGLGEAASLFTANLLLARIFHGLIRRPPSGPERVRALFLLDEAQSYAPSLLRGLVEEGRKFGGATVLATQSLDRLDETLGRGTMATIGTLLVLRGTASSAPRLRAALGLPEVRPGEDEVGPPGPDTLPAHVAWVRAEGEVPLRLCSLPAPRPTPPGLWETVSDRDSSRVAPLETGQSEESREADLEAVLLEAAMAEAGASRRLERAPSEAIRAQARSQGLIEAGLGPAALTEKGWGRLGANASTGARRETTEHKLLLLAAFRIFARQGVRLELPVQGGFDLLPDGKASLLPEAAKGRPARELVEAIARRREGWLWRLGGGRDVHVEVEVSSAVRVQRLHHSLEKGRRSRAFVLFIVGSTADGRRIRRMLAREEIERTEATVWVLRLSKSLRAPAVLPSS